MVADDKKAKPKEKAPKEKTSVDAPTKGETATEAPAEAKTEAKAESPKNYSRGEGQKPVSQAYKDNWNAIYAKKKGKKKKR
jgi:hypothetical protein